jgi:hypothetical protein
VFRTSSPRRIRPIKDFGINAVFPNKPINAIATCPTTFVALDPQHVELTNNIAEYDYSFSWNFGNQVSWALLA